MSAHYQYATLPAREIKEQSENDIYYNGRYNIYEQPELFDIEVVGQTWLSFVSHSERLIVFKDKISKQVFYVELRDSEYIEGLQLLPREIEYSGHDTAGDWKEIPTYYLVWPEKLEQFKNFIMGWKPNVWDYDRKEREKLCRAVEAAMTDAPKCLP